VKSLPNRFLGSGTRTRLEQNNQQSATLRTDKEQDATRGLNTVDRTEEQMTRH